jgi:hypothetical protein
LQEPRQELRMSALAVAMARQDIRYFIGLIITNNAARNMPEMGDLLKQFHNKVVPEQAVNEYHKQCLCYAFDI